MIHIKKHRNTDRDPSRIPIISYGFFFLEPWPEKPKRRRKAQPKGAPKTGGKVRNRRSGDEKKNLLRSYRDFEFGPILIGDSRVFCYRAIEDGNVNPNMVIKKKKPHQVVVFEFDRSRRVSDLF